jgi:hypothetical protein
MFASIAYSEKAEVKTADCYGRARVLVMDDISIYRKLWSEEGQEKRYPWTKYQERIINDFIRNSGCWDTLKALEDKIYRDHPDDLMVFLDSEVKKVDYNSLSYYGVDIPDKATVGVFGTKIKIGFRVFIQSLQVALVPILVIWIGSIYQTRFRELQTVVKADDVSLTFPHIINMYPIGYFPSMRKKNFLARHADKIWGFFYLIIRWVYVSIVIVPPIVFFLAGLYYASLLNSQFAPAILWFIIGLFVAMLGLGVFVVEFFAFYKVFPGNNPLRKVV